MHSDETACSRAKKLISFCYRNLLVETAEWERKGNLCVWRRSSFTISGPKRTRIGFSWFGKADLLWCVCAHTHTGLGSMLVVNYCRSKGFIMKAKGRMPHPSAASGARRNWVCLLNCRKKLRATHDSVFLKENRQPLQTWHFPLSAKLINFPITQREFPLWIVLEWLFICSSGV